MTPGSTDRVMTVCASSSARASRPSWRRRRAKRRPPSRPPVTTIRPSLYTLAMRPGSTNDLPNSVSSERARADARGVRPPLMHGTEGPGETTMNILSRRGFLAASAAAVAAAQRPRLALAQTPAPIRLTAATRTLDIDGRAARVFGLAGPGGQGLVLDSGQRFRVDLTNDLDIGTIIHWHGQIPPNAQDGVPDMPMPLLAAGETRSYDFEARPGTHWMHSHVPVQEMQLLAAPLIVRSQEDIAADRQEVVMFLHDFSFKTPERSEE